MSVVLTLVVKGDAESAAAMARARGFSTAARHHFKRFDQTRVEAVGDEMAAHRWFAEQPPIGPTGYPPGTLLHFTVALRAA